MYENISWCKNTKNIKASNPKKSAEKVKKWYMYRNKKIKIYLWIGVSITEKKYIHYANIQR